MYASMIACYSGLDLDDPCDKIIYNKYLIPMVKGLAAEEYREDPYYKKIKIPNETFGKWRLENKSYAPYEAFVYDDMEMRYDGRLLPHIGYFTDTLEYPSVSENGREWMTVTPNEINTMKKAISSAKGNELTFGLGLGYYAYMVSRKQEVKTVTVVERDREVIELFEKFILPQFENRDKIKIVCADAFEFADTRLRDGEFDHVFTDLWHDASDGMELYQKMKGYEKSCPDTEFDYWIVKTIKIYLEDQ